MLSRRLEKRIRREVETYKDMPNAKQKHFSFIVKRNNIVGIGWNDGWKTHPLSARFGHRFSTIHSELAAIRDFVYTPSELQGTLFINVRLMADGTFGMSKPCEFCQAMLASFEVDRVIYSQKNTFKEILLC